MEPCLELPAPQKTALSLSFSIKTIAFDYGGGCNGIVLTKNRDCLSFFTNCALLLGPVPNLMKALHHHGHRYNDDDVHQTTEALSIISSIIRPGSSPSSSTFLTCNRSLICKYLVFNYNWSLFCKYLVYNFSSSGIYSTTPSAAPSAECCSPHKPSGWQSPILLSCP